MNEESEERPFEPADWAEYLPIPAAQHPVVRRGVEMPDMAKAKHVESMILGLGGLALLMAAVTAIVLSALGVNP